MHISVDPSDVGVISPELRTHTHNSQQLSSLSSPLCSCPGTLALVCYLSASFCLLPEDTHNHVSVSLCLQNTHTHVLPLYRGGKLGLRAAGISSCRCSCAAMLEASDVQPVTTGEECHAVIQPSFDRRKLVLSHTAPRPVISLIGTGQRL